MRRRRFFKAIAAAPAATALAAQQAPRAASPGAASQAPAFPGMGPSAQLPKLEISVADDAAQPLPRFFNAAQFSTLRRLAEVLMPAMDGLPGAIEAGAPEFLDFLIGASPADRQELYKKGLDLLNAQAKKQFGKAFSEVDGTQAATLLAPLREPWTPDPPADPLARFLRAAKQDVRTATLNSREYATASAASGGRRASAVGLYWYPLD